MLSLSLPSLSIAGSNRLEAGLRVIALVWGLIIGLAYYGFLLLVAIPGAIDILYQGVFDSDGIGISDTINDWMMALTYWESDNYAYAFAKNDEPAWLPDTERSR